jgi:DNA-directed RNA polymerase subunit H
MQGKFTQYQRILNAIEPVIEESKDEHVYMIQDSVSERVHSLVASHLWFKYKVRISFFCVYEIVVNPLEHVLVPRHEQVPTAEIPDLMKRIRITEKSQLPLIRYHTDPIGRLIGLVPGDIVKISRPSPASGEYILYRACVP